MRWIAGTLLLLGASMLASAEQRTSLLDIDVVLGFSDTFRLGRWTPVTVTVGNRGNAVTGELDVDVIGGDEFQGSLFTVTRRRHVELPRDARKQFRFTLLLESFSHPLTVRVTAGGQELARHEVELRHRFATGRLVLVLSRDADLDYLNEASGDTLRVLYPHPELLPHHWQGYDGVQAVVVHGLSLERLDGRQYEALEKWIAGGGTLVVSGGPDYTVLRTPRLAALLPGVPTGSVRFADGTALGSVLGAPVHAPRPFDVNRVARHGGRARYRAGGVPLVIEDRRGRGRVLYATFDIARYPFDRWPGMESLLLDGLEIAPVERREQAPAPAEQSKPLLALLKSPRGDFPGHAVVLVFLALYLGLLATGYRLRPAGPRGRWLSAACTWAAPVLFAPAAFLLFGPLLFPRGATAVSVATVAPHPGGPYADLELRIGLYANRTQPLRLDYDGAHPTLHPAPPMAEQGATSDWVLASGAHESAQPAGERPYVLHLLEGRDVIPFDVAASLEETRDGFHLRVRNDSGRPIRDALLMVDGTVFPLGVLPTSSAERVLGEASGAYSLDVHAWREILGAQGAGPALGAREGLVLKALAGDRAGDARLLGFTRSPLRPIGAWQGRAVTLVAVPVPVERTAVEVPVHGGPG